MNSANLEKRFRGQARLVRLLLWKVGETTDIDTALESALNQGMITSEDASFLSECMAAEESGRDSETLSIDVTADVIKRLQSCADKLNRADSA